ncbi:hypothetical protein ACFSC4_08710 [Deinococcus malanensis]|uniref:hypothetical protein n=1 Tax=Deinococcus malanensis TaxID=1706855 RepID=UPI0036335A62
MQGQQDMDPSRSAFVLGYFTHLVSDNLWMHFIGRSTQETFGTEFAAHRAATWERVKDDWYGLDHKYLRDHPHNVFSSQVVPAPNPPSPLPFLGSEALAHRLDDLREFYAQPGGFVLDRSYPYLSEDSMNRVVEDCARAIVVLTNRLEAGEIPADQRISLHVMDLPVAYTLP